MIRLSVMYPAAPGSRFNWDYYLGPHLALSQKLLAPRGSSALKSTVALAAFLLERPRPTTQSDISSSARWPISKARLQPPLPISSPTSETTLMFPASCRSVRWWSSARSHPLPHLNLVVAFQSWRHRISTLSGLTTECNGQLLFPTVAKTGEKGEPLVEAACFKPGSLLYLL